MKRDDDTPTPPGLTDERWDWLRSQCAAMDREANRGAGKPRAEAA